MKEVVRVGLVQMTCSSNLSENQEKALEYARQAASQGADIVCLQELFGSPYFCQEEETARFDLAEPIPGPTTTRLAKVANELGIAMVVPLFEKRAEGIYHNSAVILDCQGSISGTYRKMHIPDDPLYYEKFYFTPGDLGFKVHRTADAKVGVLICYDQWFPEAVRIVALKGAQIVFFPTAIGWVDGESLEMKATQHSAWETIQRSQAIANGLFVVSVNRVGREDGLTFWGQSFVSDPYGRLLAKASDEREEVLVVECAIDQVEKTRREWSFLRDRRVDAYSDLSRVYIDDLE